MTKLSKAKAARLVDRTDRCVRYWVEKGLLPEELHTEDLPRLRELAGYTKMSQDSPKEPAERIIDDEPEEPRP